jgi:hypothetical protein
MGQHLVLVAVCCVVCSSFELVQSSENTRDFSNDRLQRNVNIATFVFMLSAIPTSLGYPQCPVPAGIDALIFTLIGEGLKLFYVILLLFVGCYAKSHFMGIIASKLTLVGMTNEFKLQMSSSRARVQFSLKGMVIALFFGIVAFVLTFTFQPSVWYDVKIMVDCVHS